MMIMLSEVPCRLDAEIRPIIARGMSAVMMVVVMMMMR